MAKSYVHGKKSSLNERRKSKVPVKYLRKKKRAKPRAYPPCKRCGVLLFQRRQWKKGLCQSCRITEIQKELDGK